MRAHRTLPVSVPLAVVVVLFLTLASEILASSPHVLAAGALSLSAQAAPAVVAPGATVTYTISLSNAGSGSPHVRITDTLPAGFTYVAGSATLSVDGVTLSYYDPVISGQSISWGMTPYPGARGLFAFTDLGGVVVRRVAVGHGPYAVGANPTNGLVYVGQAGASSITVLDSQGDIQTSIELGGLGLVQGLAANPQTNRIYAVYFIGPRLHAIAEIDGATNRVVARIGGDYSLPLTDAYGITIDAGRNRLYVNDRGGLVEIDGATHQATRIQSAGSIGYAFGLAVDSSSKQLFSGGILSRAVSSFRAP